MSCRRADAGRRLRPAPALRALDWSPCCEHAGFGGCLARRRWNRGRGGGGHGCPTSDPIAEEQAALRRATLVAVAAAPEEVFTVATDVGRLLQVDYTVLVRNISGWAHAAGWSHIVQLRR
jgi:hypothetical protein